MNFFLLRIFQMQVRLQCLIFKKASDELAALVSEFLADHASRDDLTKSLNAWASIETMLTAAANIRKVLWSRTSEREPIRDSLGLPGASILLDLEMRDHFQHFDERIDRWWKASAPDHRVADLFITSPPQSYKGKSLWRRFNPETMDVSFWDETLNLGNLRDEIAKIHAKLDAEFAKPNWIAQEEHAERMKES